MTPKTSHSSVPDLRIRLGNSASSNAAGQYVLYWMTSSRRTAWNFGLQRAADWANSLGKPLLVFEALRCDYRWACDRFHQFVLHGMMDNAKAFTKKHISYFPYVEAKQGASRGLLAALAQDACVVVGDDFPCFFLPRMQAAAAAQIRVRFELIDSNGILPMRAAEKVFLRAYDFRRFLQKELRPHLADFPLADPLRNVKLPRLSEIPQSVTARWQATDLHAWSEESLARLPIDHHIGLADARGGSSAARKRLDVFVDSKLCRYASERNQPSEDVTSGLSPYLHFGHLSAHQVFQHIMRHEDWSIDNLADKAKGSAHDWWGTSGEAESFLDELITWRELGYNMCSQRADYDQYDSLPQWARKTLKQHQTDPRQHIYTYEQFDAAQTHDALWNAAQRQLTCEGRIHNYLRMLWGKKILEWSATPRDALDVMIELNNRYALDGRDPNSYSGIFWVLGRYDRAWGPERPIFGKIRYMSSKNTARKVSVRDYIHCYST